MGVMREHLTKKKEDLERSFDNWLETEDLYHSLIAEALFGYYVIQDDRFCFVNPKLADIFGYSVEELLQMNPLDLVLPEDRCLARDNMVRRLKGELRSIAYNLRVRSKKGDIVYLKILGSVCRYRGRLALQGNMIDITEQVKTEQALRESEKNLKKQIDYFNTLLENMNEGFCLFDLKGKAEYVNAAACRVVGYPAEELLGLSVLQFVPEKDRERIENYLKQIVEEGQKVSFIMPIITSRGEERLIKLNASPVYEEKRLVGGMMLAEDITERVKAKRALQEEKDRLAVTLRSIGEAVVTTDTKGRVTMMNRVAEELTGFKQEEAVGQDIGKVLNIINPATGESYYGSLYYKRDKAPVEISNHILVAKNGRRRRISANGAPIIDKDGQYMGEVLVFRDITEKQRIEEEMAKSSKIQSLGVLAGGIAHDFNNLLTVILGNISLAKAVVETGCSDIGNLLEEAEKGALQAKALTQQLLTFAKGGIPVKRVVDIAEVVKEATGFALSGSNVKCRFAIPPEVWSCEVDVGQVHQVINNLVINAVQAMPGGGEIVVGLENVFINEGCNLPLPKGRYVKITVMDRGVGIPHEYRDRIFDPYFTTKATGSGLGLATAYSIIKNHNGYIGVDSKVGEGSTFYVYLPASDKIVKSPDEVDLSVPHQAGRILVMDDEFSVREVIVNMLAAMGYEVEQAKDGQEAIDKYRQAMMEGKRFDMVIMDLTVPGGMGGKEAIRELLQLDPEVVAVVSSGYSSDPIMGDYQTWGFKDIIIKPFGIKELEKTLLRVMLEHRWRMNNG